MPLFFFRIRAADDDAGICNDGAEFPDAEAAWKEMTRVCADMIGSVSRGLKQNTEWQIELLDDARSPMHRIRLVTETLD